MQKSYPFVGRHMEMQQWQAWMQDEQARLHIFYIYGMGGIGKSTLMSEMRQSAKNGQNTTIWLDGRSCAQTPADFLDYVTTTIQLELGIYDRTQALATLMGASATRRFVLCIDNYEFLSLLEGWLTKVFLPKLPRAGVALILTSRFKPSPFWSTDPFWKAAITVLALEHFTVEEMIDLFTQNGGIPHSEMRALARASDGHPLALALTMQIIMDNQSLSKKERMIVSQSISAHLLREMTSAELQSMVDVLVVLQTANQEMLSQLLPKPVTIDEYRMLQTMSFIRISHEGISLHDVARMHLLRDLEVREPKRLADLRVKAVQLLYEQFRQVQKPYRRPIAAKMLLLCKEVLQVDRMYADLSVEANYIALETMHMDDLPILHLLLDGWADYSVETVQRRTLYHHFLDAIAQQFPESIAVLRDENRQPIAMFIAVLIHRETSAFLHRYFAAELSECFQHEELQNAPDSADTYYAVLGAATNDHAIYTREELVGLLSLDRLSLLGEGTRAVLVATNPNLKLFLQQLGFHQRLTRQRACDTSTERADVLELDLRNDRFADWVMNFFASEQRLTLPPTDAITEKTVRKMMSTLQQPAKLLSYAAFFANTKDGIEVQRLLYKLLEDEQSPIHEQDRQVLLAYYVTHPNNAITASQSCHWSRATFYRYLQRAISNLTIVLHNESLSSKPNSANSHI